MGRKAAAKAAAAAGGGGGGGGAATALPSAEMSYSDTACGLCRQAIDTDGEEHLTGAGLWPAG